MVGATFESKKEREPLMGLHGKNALERYGATSALCLTADPHRILWTFENLRRAARGGADDQLPSDRVLDTSVAFLER